MNKSLPQTRGFASVIAANQRMEDLLHAPQRTRKEEREVQKILRALGWVPVRKPTRIHMPRMIRRGPMGRARHTQTAQATSSGADSGGDPEPEPPRKPRFSVGGAL